MERYAHVARWFYGTVWAIYPPKLLAMRDALEFLAGGGEYSAAEIAAIIGARPREQDRPKGATAVLPLRGVISHRAGMLGEASGGTSTEAFAAQLREFVADPKIGSILLDVDSPGGSVNGVEELAAEIHSARKLKPIVASINAMAASAAYWIASAATEISITPSGEVGSIGVIAAHEDVSAQRERWGVRTTLISAGKYKGEGSPYEPLTEEARAYMQGQVDDYYGMFTRSVARGRGVPVATVREGFGEGRMVMAKDALRMGMADRVETMDETLARLSASGDGPVANPRANLEELDIQANREEPEGRSTDLERMRLELLRLR